MNLDTEDADLYIGVSGLGGNVETFYLGYGIELRPTHAHVVTEHILAYEKPIRPGGFKPTTWHATSHDDGIEISYELFIPKTYKHEKSSNREISKTIITMLRMICNPNIYPLVISNKPINSFKQEQESAGELVAALYGGKTAYWEIRIEDINLLPKDMEWIVNNWEAAHDLKTIHPEFQLAMDTYDNARYISNSAMAIVSIWGALEAIFSPHKAELVFRVSSNLAAFLVPRGEERLKKQKEIVKLYGIRSAAAHGSPKHKGVDVIRTLEILRKALIRMIHINKVPDRDMLEHLLFVS